MSKTIFEKIIAREIPGRFVYEDDFIAAFHDVNPVAPVHVLVVPKKAISGISGVTPADAPVLGHLLAKVPEIAAKLGLDSSGYRLTLNCGRDAGEVVPHLHFHIMGGRPLGWPPG